MAVFGAEVDKTGPGASLVPAASNSDFDLAKTGAKAHIAQAQGFAKALRDEFALMRSKRTAEEVWETDKRLRELGDALKALVHATRTKRKPFGGGR